MLVKIYKIRKSETKTYDILFEDNGKAVSIALSDDDLDIKDKITVKNYKELLLNFMVLNQI